MIDERGDNFVPRTQSAVWDARYVQVINIDWGVA